MKPVLESRKRATAMFRLISRKLEKTLCNQLLGDCTDWYFLLDKICCGILIMASSI